MNNMSKASKLHELLQRAQALQERLNQTQAEENEIRSLSTNTIDGNGTSKTKHRCQTTPNRLSLKKKKKKKKYFENIENVSTKNLSTKNKIASARAKKSKLFGSIQFSSDEDQDLEKSKACDKCDGNTVLLQKRHGCSMSVDYPASTNQESLDVFVPDSYESISNVSSQNISDLVRPENVVNVKDSFSSEVSDIVAGHLSKMSDVNFIPETQPCENDLTPPAPCDGNQLEDYSKGDIACTRTDNVFPHVDKKNINTKAIEQQKDTNADKRITSLRMLHKPDFEESVLMLSQRLEKMLTKEKRNHKKTHNDKYDSSDSTSSRASSVGCAELFWNPRSSTKKSRRAALKKHVSVQDSSNNHSRLFSAIYYSSDDDNSNVVDTGAAVVSPHSDASGDRSDNILSASERKPTTNKSDQSHEEITFLKKRMENILSSRKKNLKDAANNEKPVKLKKKTKQSKKLVLPDLFESDSDVDEGRKICEAEVMSSKSAHEHPTVMTTSVSPSRPPQPSTLTRQSQEINSEDELVEKRDMSLQVSLVSTPGYDGSIRSPHSPDSCYQEQRLASETSKTSNASYDCVEIPKVTPCSSEAIGSNAEVSHPSEQNAVNSSVGFENDVTKKSLQSSFISEASEDTSYVHEMSCIIANVTDKSLQVSILSEDGLSPLEANSPRLDQSTNEHPSYITSEQPEHCNISLQVSMMSSDASEANHTPKHACTGSDVSSVVDDIDGFPEVNQSPNEHITSEQPEQCNISLQVSMMSSDASEINPTPEHSSTGSDVSSVVDDIFYKTALEPEMDLSDPALYKTVMEYRPSASPPGQVLFPTDNHKVQADYGMSCDENHVQKELSSGCSVAEDKTKETYEKSPSVRSKIPQNMQYRMACLISSSESEQDNQHGPFSESGSESDNMEGCAQQLTSVNMRQTSHDDRNIISHTATAIRPDEMYDKQNKDRLLARSPIQAQLLSASSDEDDLETFFQKMQKPKLKTSTMSSMSDFIVLDELSSGAEDDESIFYIKTNRILSSDSKKLPRSSLKTPRSTALRYHSYVGSPELTDDDSEDEENVFKTPVAPPVKPKSLTCKPQLPKSVLSNINNFATPRRKPPSVFEKRPINFDRPNSTGHDSVRKGFLGSLGTDCSDHKKHLDSIKYVKNMKKHKEELTAKLFKMYNETVFANKLPSDLTILWNTRMYKTAGYCTYKKIAKVDERTARVELSVKVCDTAERVRDTLIHELCHAAVWLFHGKTDGHGPCWKHWAHKANLIHPDLPVISRCHNYKILTKYTYKCVSCGYQIGRHSKSLDTVNKVCGYCKSPFELIVNYKSGAKSGAQTPRTPNPFSMFVKEHYSAIKKQGQFSHKEVMNKLGAEFALKNKVST